LERKKMFGGVGYLSRGNMVAGVSQDSLLLRASEAMRDDLLRQPWCQQMEMGGRLMKGWLFVSPEGWNDPVLMADLVAQAKAYVDTMPTKTSKKG
ncbi:MAG TPA: TfoX/Sxy family protein, partial [Saprospiraceae bacterium]|nr:TfoX/Sxy family protein [Saprospiraceae bacterium]